MRPEPAAASRATPALGGDGGTPEPLSDHPALVSTQVRRPLPNKEPNTAKRLLFLLLAIIFCQILMAEEGMSPPLAPEEAPVVVSSEPSPAPPTLELLNQIFGSLGLRGPQSLSPTTSSSF